MWQISTVISYYRRRWILNSGLNKSFEEYVNSLLKRQHCTYRWPDSEDVPQYGWDTHYPFTNLPHSSASGTDLVYAAKGLTYIVGSYTMYVYIRMDLICAVSMYLHCAYPPYFIPWFLWNRILHTSVTSCNTKPNVECIVWHAVKQSNLGFTRQTMKQWVPAQSKRNQTRLRKYWQTDCRTIYEYISGTVKMVSCFPVPWEIHSWNKA